MSAAKPTQTAPATAFSVCVYRAAIEKLNACRQKCPGIGGDIDVSNLHFLIYDNLRSASIEAQAANTLESFARDLEINATREVEALRMLDAAPETAAERDRLRESNTELINALQFCVAVMNAKGGSMASERKTASEKARAAIAKAKGGAS